MREAILGENLDQLWTFYRSISDFNRFPELKSVYKNDNNGYTLRKNLVRILMKDIQDAKRTDDDNSLQLLKDMLKDANIISFKALWNEFAEAFNYGFLSDVLTFKISLHQSTHLSRPENFNLITFFENMPDAALHIVGVEDPDGEYKFPAEISTFYTPKKESSTKKKSKLEEVKLRLVHQAEFKWIGIRAAVYAGVSWLDANPMRTITPVPSTEQKFSVEEKKQHHTLDEDENEDDASILQGNIGHHSQPDTTEQKLSTLNEDDASILQGNRNQHSQPDPEKAQPPNQHMPLPPRQQIHIEQRPHPVQPEKLAFHVDQPLIQSPIQSQPPSANQKRENSPKKKEKNVVNIEQDNPSHTIDGHSTFKQKIQKRIPWWYIIAILIMVIMAVFLIIWYLKFAVTRQRKSPQNNE